MNGTSNALMTNTPGQCRNKDKSWIPAFAGMTG